FQTIRSGQPATTAIGSSGGDTQRADSESNSVPLAQSSSAAQLAQPSKPLKTGATIVALDQNAKLDRMTRHRVIAKVIEYLEQYYVDPDVAHKIANALLAHEKNGDYDAVTDGALFADVLTRQMRDVSRDRQLIVVYSQVATPDPPSGPTSEEIAQYR